MEARLPQLLSDSPHQRLQAALETLSELAEAEATPLATQITTEFHFAGAAEVPEKATLPYCTQSPGGWAGIFESRAPGFPAMSLVKNDARTFLAHLPDKPHDPAVAYVGVTPWTGPWRIVAVGTEREKLAQSSAVQALAQ